jgi:hypothetical protein
MGITVKTTDNNQQDLHEWLTPENWPVPKWYGDKQGAEKIRTYDAYFAHQLRVRYVELENDFRTVFGNFGLSFGDRVTAERIVALLHTARKMLEEDNSNSLSVSSVLDLVERYMVWLYPPHIAMVRIGGVIHGLQTVKSNGKDSIVIQLTKLSEGQPETYSGQLRALLDEALGIINKQAISDQIGTGLQIERLKAFWRWGMAFLVIFLIASPIVTNLAALKDWPSQLILREQIIVAAWINALGIIIVGAAGGLLSGLLQARSSRVTLTEYQENMLKLRLKPLVGSLVSLVLYVLLSWGILPGITIQNAGSYFIIAFLSGFSERYFLRLLELKKESEMGSEESDTSKLVKEASP